MVSHSRFCGRSYRKGWLSGLRYTLGLAGLAFTTAVAFAGTEYRLSFDDIGAGQLPTGWTVAATSASGPLAEWQVEADKTAPSAPNVLTLSRIQDTSRGVFNLFWTDKIRFADGELSVRIRANGGEIDQGGGLIWRVKDANNYYIARYNPLEHNIRLYYVKNGRRVQLASADRNIGSGEWFTLRIVHRGQRIQGWVNGTQAWDKTDDQLADGGGVGLWSKADAASSFDDLIVRVTP